MKKAFKLIFAVALCGLAFSSCSQDIIVDDPVLSSAKGTRIINATFASATKTALGEDGLTPHFVNGDMVWVYNGIDPAEKCPIHVDGDGNASFSTELTGPLSVVYPAEAVLLEDGEFKGLSCPAVQSGKFEDANVSEAYIEEGEATAVFEIRFALLKITPPEGTKQLTITSLKRIGTDGQRSGVPVPINNEDWNSSKSETIMVGDGTEALGTCYVALCLGAYLSDLSFDTGSAMKGVPEKDIIAAGKDKEITAGTMYTIGNSGWHPYVIIGGKKWATMNLGAEKETDYGIYYSWGDVTGQVPSASSFTKPFEWANTPFNNGQSNYDEKYFDNIIDDVCPSGVLALKYDAAYYNWGGAWRMPTEKDFDILTSCTKSWDSTNPGYILTESTNSIYLPAAGYGMETLSSVGERGYYWSSTLSPAPISSRILYIYQGYVNCNGRNRYVGHPIRPILD